MQQRFDDMPLRISGKDSSASADPELMAAIGRIFTRYISGRTATVDNLEHLLSAIYSSEARKQIAPLLVFQILTRFRKRLCDGELALNFATILNRKEYVIHADNGKNFDTYEEYLNCFEELMQLFHGICDADLCRLGLERVNNLTEWYIRTFDD